MFAVTQTETHTPASLDPDAASGGRLVATDGRSLPLQSAHLTVEARGGIARAVLVQRFANPDDQPLSVRYLLPLPARAAVAGFAFTLGDTRVVGEVQPKQTARQMFDDAVLSGRTAALVEEERSTLFTQRVGNIPPRSEVVCEITLDQQLAWLDEGAWAWRFPTVVGPRYTGGVTADAARISVPVSAAALPARASLDLRIGDPLTGAVRSPSHHIGAETDDGETTVRLAHSAALDRDIVVRWPVAAPAVGVQVTAARPADPAHQGRTYGLLSLVPPSVAMKPRARDLVLLIDTSGSMGGQPLDQAKRVMQALVERLGDRDRVEMISFGSRPVRFRSEPIVASKDGKKAALKWLRKLSASGGTEMHTAIVEALRPLRSDAQRQIVLVTDGYIGFEQQIMHRLLTDLPPDSRLHTIGVGSAPNRTLTEGAARAGRGTELIIGLGEDADAAAERMVARTADPLVTEISVTGPGLAELAPMQLPDLYAGSPALVGVACAAAGPLTIRGRTADGPFEHTVEVPKLALGQGAQGVTALFGRNRVDDLELRLTAGEPVGAIDPQIEAAGVLFGSATRKTSWIAITDAVTVQPGTRDEVEQPHMLPHGASVEGFGLRAAAPVAFGGAAPPPPPMAAPAPRGEFVLSLSSRMPAAPKKRKAEAAPTGISDREEARADVSADAFAADAFAADAYDADDSDGSGALSDDFATLEGGAGAPPPPRSAEGLIDLSTLTGLDPSRADDLFGGSRLQERREPTQAELDALRGLVAADKPRSRIGWLIIAIIAFVLAALAMSWLAPGGDAPVEPPPPAPEAPAP